MKPADSYAELLQQTRNVALLGSCSAVLGWDQQTYMPPAGAEFRGEQLALLAGLTHQKATDPRIGELLAAVENTEIVADPDSVEAANIREIRHSYDRATKLPQRLVEELARVTTMAQQVWQEARSRNEYALFQPHLERILELKREEADAIGHTGERYDALLDEYEPGSTTAEIQTLFDDLSRQLVPLIQQITSRKLASTEVLHRDYPVDRQRLFAESAAAAIGFDFQAGRLDVTTHPFCSGFGPGDCRITTRYNPKFFSEAFFGVLHEAGHGMYEQGLRAEGFGTPCGSYCSLGIHESQSRFWENQVGRSRPFWNHFFPRLRQAFPSTIGSTSPDEFYAAINVIEPSLIRVEADEATYNLHIILRFRIERALLSGDLHTSDLPATWNALMHELLGIRPPTDREGCLQDIHWSFGGLGYFPTYTLGNLYSAQFMQAMRNQLGCENIHAAMQAGDFSIIKNWLSHHIYSSGRRFRARKLCARITNQELFADAFVEYLTDKFANT